MLFDQIQEAIELIRSRTGFQPRFGLILGTGLGNLGLEISVTAEIPYGEIPHFPVSTVESHAGKLIFGHLEGHAVVAMSGRFHYYEGYTMQQITFPVRVLKYLGIERLFVSNAAGSVNPEYEAGDLVFIRDHINLQADNPLRGANDDRLGPRFPDMLHTYDGEMIAKAVKIAMESGLRAHSGVYVALQGPNLETPAEYHFMRIIGADVVGMSTVPEVLVARHMELPVFALSVVSNKCYPLDTLTETTLEEVIQVVRAAEPKVTGLVKQLLNEA